MELAVITMVLTFLGHKISDQLDHKHEKVEMMSRLCFEKNECEPLKQYLMRNKLKSVEQDKLNLEEPPRQVITPLDEIKELP
jgi:hypothetical protein